VDDREERRRRITAGIISQGQGAPEAAAPPPPPPPAPPTALQPELPPPPPTAAPATAPPPIQPSPVLKTTPKTYEKQTHLLTLADLAIIDRHTSLARQAAVPMRKNANPSLIVRAAIRELEHLRESNPDAWLTRIQSVAKAE
jgi:hypothetical protein